MNSIYNWFMGISLLQQIYLSVFIVLLISIVTLMTIDSIHGLKKKFWVNLLAILQWTLVIAYFPVSAFIFAVLLSIFGERY